LLHGEAIALGLRAALRLSGQHAGLDPAVTASVLSLLERFGLPRALPAHIPTEVVMEKLARDKKFAAGAIRFVLLRQAGDAFVSHDLTPADLRAAIEQLRT
jgi:3-dehydroquinate synthetase